MGIYTYVRVYGTRYFYYGHGTGYRGYSLPAHNYYFTSIGTLFNPSDSVWVPHGNWISPTSGYTIDSVTIAGIYGRPMGATYTDSLKFTFVYGNGRDTSNMPFNGFIDPTELATFGLGSTDTFWFPRMFQDSLHNTATNSPTNTTTPAITIGFPLTAMDTAVANLFVRSFPVNIVVPAGNFTGMSISFVSGGSYIPFDTVQYMNGSFKYGCFRPDVSLGWGSSPWLYPPGGGPTYPAPVTRNFVPGFFKIEGASDVGWTGEYIPSAALVASSAPTFGGLYMYAQPYTRFYAHEAGPTTEITPTSTLNEVKVYPNPASNETTIEFYLNGQADVSLSLTDVLGQVVYKQDMGNINHCKTSVNTSALPAGIYFYTIAADGQRNNGQLIVTH